MVRRSYLKYKIFILESFQNLSFITNVVLNLIISGLLNEFEELISSHNGVVVEVFPLSNVPLLK